MENLNSETIRPEYASYLRWKEKLINSNWQYKGDNPDKKEIILILGGLDPKLYQLKENSYWDAIFVDSFTEQCILEDKLEKAGWKYTGVSVYERGGQGEHSDYEKEGERNIELYCRHPHKPWKKLDGTWAKDYKSGKRKYDKYDLPKDEIEKRVYGNKNNNA